MWGLLQAYARLWLTPLRSNVGFLAAWQRNGIANRCTIPMRRDATDSATRSRMSTKSRLITVAFSVTCMICAVVLSPVTRARIAPDGTRLPEPARTIPVRESEVRAFPTGDFVDQQTTEFNYPNGDFILVYGRLKGGYLRNSSLWFVVSEKDKTISKTKPLPIENDAEFHNMAVASPSFVTGPHGTWLYFETSGRNEEGVKLWKSRLSGTTFSEPVELSPVPGLTDLAALPSWANAGSYTYLTFRNKRGLPFWVRLRDGVAQGAPQRLEPFGVGFARVIPMGGGGCFFSYQIPWQAGGMATYYRTSRDCSHWSPPALLSHQPIRFHGKPVAQVVVHDAYALARLRHGVDVYYSAVNYKGEHALRSKFGFVLYRRSVEPNGTLGPEQLLTAKPIFYPFYASAHRLANGSVLVTFSDIHSTGNDIYLKGSRLVTSSDLTVFALKSDAPVREPRHTH